jgi:hypothetical protein
MADVLSGLVVMAISAFGTIARFVLGGIFVLLILLVIYLIWFRDKKSNKAKERFTKRFEATAERCGFVSKKLLALCPYPYSLEDMKNPIYQLNHQPIGWIIGANVYGIIHSFETLLKYTKSDGKNDELKKLIEENKEAIEQDKFWIVYAYQKAIKGIWVFKRNKRSLLFVKPSQIINSSSIDGIIRVRGFGIQSLGEYEIINDENANLTRMQLFKDLQQLDAEEITLGGWDYIGETVTHSMTADSSYRKDLAYASIKPASTPVHSEANT